jgi:hypothetical protein
LQVLNLVPNSAAHGLTFYLDDSVFSGPFGFASATAFGTVRAGQHRIEVGVPHGRMLVNMRVHLLANQSYSFAAEGMQGGRVAGLLVPDMWRSAAAGKAAVRFADAIPNSAAVVATLVGRGPQFGATAFARMTGYRSIAAGNYDLRVTTTSGKALLTVPHITIQAGKTYTMYAIGPAGGRGAKGVPALVLSP